MGRQNVNPPPAQSRPTLVASLKPQMKRLIQILTLPTIIIGYSLTATVFAWGITTKEFAMPFVWVATIIGLIMTFVHYKAGLVTLILCYLAWLILFADYFGHFLTFNLFQLEKWGFHIPFVFCPLILSIIAFRELTKNKKVRLIGILATILIPTIGFASYYDKTLIQNTFSEFHGLDDSSNTYMGRFRATPMDARYFEVNMASPEVKTVVKNVGTFSVGHYYVNDTRLRVRMRFNQIREVELYRFKDTELKDVVKWKTADLNGQTEFLKR